MATKTTKTKTTTKKGKGLTKKYGPFPLWVYLGVVGIVVLYLYYRHRRSQSGQSSSVSSGGYVQPQPASGTDIVPSGNANTSTGDTGGGTQVSYPTDYASQTDLANAIDAINNNTAAAIAAITFPNSGSSSSGGGSSGDGSGSSGSGTATKTTASKTAAKKAAPAQPFGGVVSTKKLKNGAILTTYASGRQIEKAPGKTAYVVKK